MIYLIDNAVSPGDSLDVTLQQSRSCGMYAIVSRELS